MKSRKRDFIISKIEKKKNVCLKDALNLLKKYSIFNFNESIDISLKLSIDFIKNKQNIKGKLNFPYNYLKFLKILIFVDGYLEYFYRSNGYLYVGVFSLKSKFIKNNFDFEYFITISKYYKYIFMFQNILKVKNITPVILKNHYDIWDYLLNISQFSVNFKSDKFGNINLSIGKMNYSISFLEKNLYYFIDNLKIMKNVIYGNFKINKVVVSSTMGVGYNIFINNQFLF